jgi:hypothetical protein
MILNTLMTGAATMRTAHIAGGGGFPAEGWEMLAELFSTAVAQATMCLRYCQVSAVNPRIK